MGKITKLEVQKNNKQKVNLFIDDEFYSRVYLDTCVKYGLKVGKEIEEEKIKQIIAASEKELALNFVAKYVTNALKTKKQVRDYLKKKEFDTDIIEYVMDKLIEYKYIDDINYIKSYVNTYSSKFGQNKIIQNLKQKGVSQKDIDEYFNENEIEDEYNKCYACLIKKAKNMELNEKNTQKCIRFLASRGFSYDDIKTAINTLKQGEKYGNWD